MKNEAVGGGEIEKPSVAAPGAASGSYFGGSCEHVTSLVSTIFERAFPARKSRVG